MWNPLKSATKATDDETSAKLPKVTRVTEEGRVLYDPLSVIRSEPARKHLEDLGKQDPAKPNTARP